MTPHKTSPLLAIAQELDRLGSSPDSLMDPAGFISALSELQQIDSRDPEAPHVSARGLTSQDARPDGCLSPGATMASALSEHAIDTLATLGSHSALMKAARACSLSSRHAPVAQKLFSKILKRAALGLHGELLKALFDAGARCQTKYSLGALCENGGAALLEDPQLAEAFLDGLRQDLRAKPESSVSGSAPLPAMEYLSIYVFPRAPISFAQRAIDACSEPETHFGLANLRASMLNCARSQHYFAKKNDAAYWNSRSRNGRGECPHDFSEAESARAQEAQTLFASAIRNRLALGMESEPGTPERKEAIRFMRLICVKQPSLFLALAEERAEDRFSAREIGGAGPSEGAEPLAAAEQEARLSYFELAFFSGAQNNLLQATAARVERPDTALIGELLKKRTLHRQGMDQQAQLWLETLAGAPSASRDRKTLRV